MLLKLCVLNLLMVAVYCGKPKGVSIERASLYDHSKPFACLDGSGVIPFEMVNDDYCDCRDGSDEPGTSACINGLFSCDNHGYVTSSIPSSRVNDGICDCCDGSDEHHGRTQCENTCAVLAEKMREEQEKTKKLLEIGLNKKQELLLKGAELRKALKARVDELEASKSNAENEKIQSEEIKNAAEAKAREATDVEDKIIEEERKRLEAIEKEAKSNEVFALLDGDRNGILSASELLGHNELDSLFDNDGHFTIEEAQKLIDQKTDLKQKEFFEQYYDKLQPHLKFDEPVKEDEKPQEQQQQQQDQEQEHHDENDLNTDDGSDVHEDGDHDVDYNQPATPATPTTESKLKYTAETQQLLDEAEKARNTFNNADRDLRNIQNDIDNIKRKLNYDVGPNEEFASLVDECYEFDDREYIYKLCPFDKTVQKSKSNSGETSIGTWSSWNDENPANKYKIMKFANGLTCWNGPARSTKVHLLCGVDNKVISVSEPNRCEYEMKFETPIVCDASSGGDHAKHDHSEL